MRKRSHPCGHSEQRRFRPLARHLVSASQPPLGSEPCVHASAAWTAGAALGAAGAPVEVTTGARVGASDGLGLAGDDVAGTSRPYGEDEGLGVGDGVGAAVG